MFLGKRKSPSSTFLYEKGREHLLPRFHPYCSNKTTHFLTITESPGCIRAAQRWSSYTLPSRMLTPTEYSGHPSLWRSGKDYCPHQRIHNILCLYTLLIIPFCKVLSTVFSNFVLRVFTDVLMQRTAQNHFFLRKNTIPAAMQATETIVTKK